MSVLSSFASPNNGDTHSRHDTCRQCSDVVLYDNLVACAGCDDMICGDCQHEHRGEIYCLSCLEHQQKEDEDAGTEGIL